MLHPVSQHGPKEDDIHVPPLVLNEGDNTVDMMSALGSIMVYCSLL